MYSWDIFYPFSCHPPPLFYKYIVNLGRFILILKITNFCASIYIYIFEKYITCKAGDIYFFF